jgi:hypothetical protein
MVNRLAKSALLILSVSSVAPAEGQEQPANHEAITLVEWSRWCRFTESMRRDGIAASDSVVSTFSALCALPAVPTRIRGNSEIIGEWRNTLQKHWPSRDRATLRKLAAQLETVSERHYVTATSTGRELAPGRSVYFQPSGTFVDLAVQRENLERLIQSIKALQSQEPNATVTLYVSVDAVAGSIAENIRVLRERANRTRTQLLQLDNQIDATRLTTRLAMPACVVSKLDGRLIKAVPKDSLENLNITALDCPKQIQALDTDQRGSDRRMEVRVAAYANLANQRALGTTSNFQTATSTATPLSSLALATVVSNAVVTQARRDLSQTLSLTASQRLCARYRGNDTVILASTCRLLDGADERVLFPSRDMLFAAIREDMNTALLSGLPKPSVGNMDARSAVFWLVLDALQRLEQRRTLFSMVDFNPSKYGQALAPVLELIPLVRDLDQLTTRALVEEGYSTRQALEVGARVLLMNLMSTDTILNSDHVNLERVRRRIASTNELADTVSRAAVDLIGTSIELFSAIHAQAQAPADDDEVLRAIRILGQLLTAAAAEFAQDRARSVLLAYRSGESFVQALQTGDYRTAFLRVVTFIPKESAQQSTVLKLQFLADLAAARSNEEAEQLLKDGIELSGGYRLKRIGEARVRVNVASYLGAELFARRSNRTLGLSLPIGVEIGSRLTCRGQPRRPGDRSPPRGPRSQQCARGPYFGVLLAPFDLGALAVSQVKTDTGVDSVTRASQLVAPTVALTMTIRNWPLSALAGIQARRPRGHGTVLGGLILGIAADVPLLTLR